VQKWDAKELEGGLSRPFLRNCYLVRRVRPLWVAKSACRLENKGCFPANQTKVDLLAVVLIKATNAIEFCAIGFLVGDD